MTREPNVPSLTYRSSLSELTSSWSEIAGRTTRRLRAVSFWLAVGLPWLVLGLVASGLALRRPELLGGTVAATVLCALGGRNHSR